MTEYIERSGPGRRRHPSDDRALKCLWCEDKDEASKERWAEHLKDEHERREVCGKMVEKLQQAVASNVPWKFFYIIMGLAVGAVGWLYVDHFGLSGKVQFNTAIIQTIKEDVKGIDIKLDESLSNQRILIKQLQLPAEKK